MEIKDFIKEMHDYGEEQDRKHPWRVWIDKLFKGKSIAHYRPSYSILHPWVIADYIISEIKYAWQRVFRGWDDRVIWSIDYHIAEVLPVWMRQLKKDGIGIPGMLFHEGDEYTNDDGVYVTRPEAMERASKEWGAILESVAVGFESYTAIDEYKYKTPEERELLNKKFEEGFDLFRKYWGCFWD